MEKCSDWYRQIFFVVIATVVSLVTAQQERPINASDICAVTSRGPVTWQQCERILTAWVGGGDISSVFQGSNYWWWLPLQEPELRDLCKIYQGARDTTYITRSSISPEPERHLSDGFHRMISYLLCDSDGARGYLGARVCLQSDLVEERIIQCFQPYYNHTSTIGYRAIADSDQLTHQHCDVLKQYQQCRIDVFTEECHESVAEWNDRAFVRYYEKYANSLDCDLGDGLKTKEIVFIVIGCLGGVLVLFCASFCCSRFFACGGDDATSRNMRIKYFLKQRSQKKKTPAPSQASKGPQKDAEAGKGNGRLGGYYNTKERDNNAENDQRESERGGTQHQPPQRPLGPIPEGPELPPDRRRDPRFPGGDLPRGYPEQRGFPQGSPRLGYPHDYRRDRFPGVHPHYPPSPRLGGGGGFGGNRGRSYDEMFRARVQNGGFPRDFRRF